MVKKIQKKPAEAGAEAPSGHASSPLGQAIKDSAQQIWLAGLGAFAKAKAQGGGKVFETLMKEGASLQRRTQAAAEEKLGDVAGKMTAMADEVGHKANAQWDKLETIFEERTARALSRLGVPSAKELAALSARVDALTATLGGAAKPPAAAKAGVARFKAGKGTRDSATLAAAPESAAAAAAPAKKTRRAAKSVAAAASVAEAVAAKKPAARKRAKPAA